MASWIIDGAAWLTRVGRLRRVVPLAGQGALGVVCCGLWLGVASPSLQLLPGVDGFADESVEISLQSAMLGIEDASGRAAAADARAAADVLGLAFAEEMLMEPVGSDVPANGIVQLDEVAARLAAAPPSTPDEGSAAVPDAPSPQSVAPPAADPPPTIAVPVDEPARPEPVRPEPVAVDVPAPAAAPKPAPKADPVVVLPEPEPRDQIVAFATTPPAEPVVGGSYDVVATASSGLPVKLTAAGSQGACKLSGATVSFRKSGSCVVSAKQPGNQKFAAAEARQELEIGRAPQSVAFTSSPPSPARTGGSYTPAAAASSGLPVAVTASGACSADDGVVSLDAPGVCTVRAAQAGDDAWTPADAEQSFSVSLAPVVQLSQSIAFTSSPPSSAAWGGAAYTVTAASSSGLPVSFSLDAASAGVCSLAGATVSLVGVGTCTVLADQAGSSSWLAAPQVQQSFAVGKAAQSVSFSSAAPSGAVYGGPAYTVSATASSGLAPTFSIAPASAGVCSVSGSAVSFTGVGTCTLRADQPGSANWQAAPQASQSFAVAQAPQTVSFTSAAPSGAVYSGTPYVVAASASSGLAVSLGVAPASAGVCSLSGSTVSFTGVGTCTLRADQAGNANWAAAPQATQSFAVARAPQTVSFSSSTPSGATYGGPSYAASASASSGLAVTLSVAPASASVCSLSGSTVSFTGVGTCTILADQAGNANYEGAQAQQSFVVAKAAQTVSFSSSAPSGAVYGGPGYTAAASASSGLTVALSVAPASASVCSLAGSTVSMTGVGTCTILADQAGNANFEGAQAQQSFVVAKASQSVAFDTAAPSGAVFGGPAYSASASASSGLSVTLSVAPASAGVCALSGSTVSMTGAGTCTLVAAQAGNAYFEAAQATQSFAVAQASQTLSITSTAPSGAVYGGPAYTVSATASSGLAPTFSIAPASAGVCSVSGSAVSFTGVGTCTLRADQPGSANWQAAPQASQSFAVAQAPQTVSFTSAAPSGAVYSGTPYVVAASASSGLAVSLGVAPASAGVCSLSGSTVSFTGVGTCTLRADQAGNANWAAAPQATQSFAVAKAPQSITFTSTPPTVDGSVYLYNVSATATSGLSVDFGTTTSGVCSVIGSWVWFHGDGTCLVHADQAGDANWAAAPRQTQSILVTGHG